MSASLRVGTLTFVELGDGEQLSASGGGRDAECVQEGSLDLEPGRTSATIPAGSIKQVTATPTPGKDISRCQVRLALTRRTEGKLDSAFKDGSVTAESQSAREINSVP